jgi:hypothetical protein
MILTRINVFVSSCICKCSRTRQPIAQALKKATFLKSLLWIAIITNSWIIPAEDDGAAKA